MIKTKEKEKYSAQIFNKIDMLAFLAKKLAYKFLQLLI